MKTTRNLSMRIFLFLTLSLFVLKNAKSQNTFPWPNSGPVGIGTTTPSEYLQVTGGNIDLSTTTKSYMIGGSSFLWNNGNSSNIYGGINSGNAGTFPTINNIFIGYLTRFSIAPYNPDNIFSLAGKILYNLHYICVD